MSSPGGQTPAATFTGTDHPGPRTTSVMRDLPQRPRSGLPDKPRSGLPDKQGLYDPRFEHDSCGVGFVVNMQGRKSNAILQQALTAVCCLNHRGAAGAEVDTGDGAGVTIQVPDAFFRAVVPFDLPPVGHYATGIAFLPTDD